MAISLFIFLISIGTQISPKLEILQSSENNNSNEFSFNLIAPTEVRINEELTIKIETQTEPQEIYDVKLFINKHTREFSEIFDGSKWRSPFNYLEAVFPSQKEFKLKALIPAETQICARLRNSQEKTNFVEVCKPITVIDNPQQNEQEDQEVTSANTNTQNNEDNRESNTKEQTNDNENNNEKKSDKEIPEKEDKKTSIQQTISQSPIENKKNEEKILLNKKSPSKTNQLTSIQEIQDSAKKERNKKIIFANLFTTLSLIVLLLFLSRSRSQTL